MSILIKGMEMPKEGNWRSIRIYPDGTIGRPIGFGDYALVEGAKAILVPPHGRLIEKNAVFELIRSFPNIDRQLPVEFMKALYELPTIIEEEEGET